MKTKTRRVTTYEKFYDRDDLLAALFPDGFSEIHSGCDGVDISFQVPGGGDYSNMELEIDESCPIKVTYTIVQES